MYGRRALAGVLAPLTIAVASVALTATTAMAATPAAPKPPKQPAVTAAVCTAAHGTIVPTTSKKGKPTKHCQGGTLNGRKVTP